MRTLSVIRAHRCYNNTDNNYNNNNSYNNEHTTKVRIQLDSYKS